MFQDDAQIEADMQQIVNATWPPARREKALRLGGVMLTELNDFFVQMGVLKLAKIAERDAAKLAWEAEQAAIVAALGESLAIDGGAV